MKKFFIRILGLAILLGAAYGGYALYNSLPKHAQALPTAKAKFGDVVIKAYTRGELRAARSVSLVAPNLFSTVQVTRIAPMGSFAHEKDLVVEFDDSERRAQLDETELEVQQTEESIKQAEADLAIRNNQDQVDLLRARYAVRRAELDVKQNPLLSEIDRKKNLLALDETKRRLVQLQSDIKSRQEQAEAQIDSMREMRRRSLIDVVREKQRIAQSKMLAPMAGLVAVRQNRATDFYFPGMQIPDIHEGDTLRPGIPVADILDLSELEVLARVGELDRANLHEGQEVSITLDAVPDQKFRGTIKTLSGMASSAVFSGDPAKKFDVVFAIDMKQLMKALGATPEQIRQVMETAARNAAHPPAQAAAFILPEAPLPVAPGPVPPAAGPQAANQPATKKGTTPGSAPAKKSRAKDDDLSAYVNATNVFGTDEERARAKLPPPPEEDSQLNVLLRPGLLADVEIFVEKIPNAISVPNQAVLEKDGRQFVFVLEKGRFEPRFIKIARRSEAVTVIADNLKAGEVVSLGDPFAKNESGSNSKKNSTVSMPPAGGGSK
jgi:HlyD family secretion protein